MMRLALILWLLGGGAAWADLPRYAAGEAALRLQSLASTAASPAHGDGNLASDGTRWFAYDPDNQLVSVWVKTP